MLVTVKVAGMISTLPSGPVRVLALDRVFECADVGGLVAEDLLGGRVDQRPRLAEDAVFALGAELAADVGGVAARRGCTRPSWVATMRGASASWLVSKITASLRKGSIRLNGIEAMP